MAIALARFGLSPQLLRQSRVLWSVGILLVVLCFAFVVVSEEFSLKTARQHTTIRPTDGVFSLQTTTLFTPDGRMVVGIDGHRLQFWDINTGLPVHHIPIPVQTGPLYAFAFNPRTSIFAVAGGDELFVVNAQTELTERIVATAETTSERDLFAYHVALHPLEPQVASLFYTVHIYDLTAKHRNQTIHTGDRGFDDAISITYSPDGNYLVTGNQKGEARVWNAETGQLIQVFSGEGSMVSDVVFDHTGTFLATANDHTKVMIWNMQTGQHVRTINISPLSAHLLGRRPHAHPRNWTTTVTFSPNGRWIAAGGSDASAGVWDVTTGKQVWALPGHSDSVLDIAFSPDGQHIATTSADNTIVIWDIPQDTDLHK